MNLTVLMITVCLPLIPVMAVTLRSGAFGRGSFGMLMRLFFMGVIAAVPAFLMEAGGMLAVSVAMRLLGTGESHAAVRALLRHILAAALVEEGWKYFVLKSSTWQKMTMETVADGIAASAVVGTGFSTVLYASWQLGALLIPADMAVLRDAMPEFLRAGAVTAFLYALLFIPSHFGYSALMGALYGVAKGSEQKKHGKRARFMLLLSVLLPVMAHGAFAASLGYGFGEKKLLWTALGLAGEALCALLAGMALGAARDDYLADLAGDEEEDGPVDFADSEEFAAFAEAAASGEAASSWEASSSYGVALSGDAASSCEEASPYEEAPSYKAASSLEDTAAGGAAEFEKADSSGHAEAPIRV